MDNVTRHGFSEPATGDTGDTANTADHGHGSPRESAVARVSVVSAHWPRRRLLSALALAAAVVVAVQALVGWEPLAAPMWTWLTIGAIILGSLAAATFVPLPGHGARLDMGCTPCAAGGGLLALAGMWLAASSAYDGGTASLGLALAGAALVRRATEPQACPT